jgi:hypothetical protein
VSDVRHAHFRSYSRRRAGPDGVVEDRDDKGDEGVKLLQVFSDLRLRPTPQYVRGVKCPTTYATADNNSRPHRANTGHTPPQHSTTATTHTAAWLSQIGFVTGCFYIPIEWYPEST